MSLELIFGENIKMRFKDFIQLTEENGFKIIPNYDHSRKYEDRRIQGKEFDALKKNKIEQALNDLKEYSEIDQFDRKVKSYFYQTDVERQFDTIHGFGIYSSSMSPRECDSGFCKGNSDIKYWIKNKEAYLCINCFRIIYTQLAIYGYWKNES